MRYRYFLGVKWSQVQILSARPKEPALTSGGAGFVCLGLVGAGGSSASQAAVSGPWSPEHCDAGGAQVVELGIGVDRQ